jgi:UDP-glucose 4-epimerase
MLNIIFQSRILVTGGAGFIGSYVIEELLKYHPSKIIILDNLVRGSLENMEAFKSHPAVEFIKGDIRDVHLLEKCIEDVDYVFHMAALRINACAANPEEAFNVMMKSTFELATLCVKHKIKKVIYSSSASVYGLAMHFPTPETENPYDNQTFYGSAKLWGEQLFRSFKFMYGLEYTALRYFNVYGPRMDMDGKYTEVMIRWLNCIQDGLAPQIHGDGCGTMDFIYVSDVAKANVAAMLAPVSDQVFNIGSGKETSLRELLQLLLRINHSTLIPEFAPENSINPVKRRLADVTKAKSLLNFEASVGLERGLRELCNWYYKEKLKTTV